MVKLELFRDDYVIMGAIFALNSQELLERNVKIIGREKMGEMAKVIGVLVYAYCCEHLANDGV